MALSRHNAATGSSSGTTTVSASLSVTVGEIVVVHVNQEVVSGAVKTITGVSDGVNTYAKRYSDSVTGAGEPKWGSSERMEVWWAYATQTATLGIVATFSATIDDAAIAVAGYQGFTGTAYQTNPWDANASLPKTANSTSGTATVSGVSTDSTAGILIAAFGSADDGALPSVPTGFSLAGEVRNTGGTNAIMVSLSDKVYSSAQAAATVAMTGTAPLGWIFCVDALTIPAGASGIPNKIYQTNFAVKRAAHY